MGNTANTVQSVVGNAGICIEASNPQPIDQVDEDDFDAHMRINARGIFLGSKYSVQQFLKQEPRANGMRGWIINFASMVSNIGMPGLSKFRLGQKLRQFHGAYTSQRDTLLPKAQYRQ
jgi:NAD(P)-dependent dehydrogenase (short-subunit alcohol dehydrogenase family)